MPHTENLNDVHGRQMINVVSGAVFHIYDKNSSASPKPLGWVSLRTMEDEIANILSRAESKFCTPNGSTCTGKTIGLLVRRHIRSGEFHYIGREASTRWASGPNLSTMADAGALDPTHETFRDVGEQSLHKTSWIGRGGTGIIIDAYGAKKRKAEPSQRIWSKGGSALRVANAMTANLMRSNTGGNQIDAVVTERSAKGLGNKVGHENVHRSCRDQQRNP
jgi:hypothetical protein